MSWINGLLIGAGEGLRRGGAAYFEERDRRKRQELEQQDRVERRMDMVNRGVRERDELDERKRSNRKQEELEHERNVQSSLDRMIARENSRYAIDEASRRAVETALIRAGSNEKVAGMPARTRPASAKPDELTQSQRDGLMILNRDWLPGETQERTEMEKLFRQARQAFPDAHPGDVAMAAKRLYDRMARDRANRYR